MLRHWPFAVPVVYFAVILAVQPSDRQIPPSEAVPGYLLPKGYARLIADDSDTSAWFLRADNAARGRMAGRMNEPTEWPKPGYPDMNHDNFFGPRYANPVPLSDRYFLEYPPAALYFFRLGLIGSGRPGTDENLNPALLDGHQLHVSMHAARTPTEEKWYGAIRHSQQVYAGILLAVLMSVMLLVRHGVGANGVARGPIWLLILPGTLYFTPSRFDMLPAACVLACVAATDRKRPLLGAGLLGLAVALKTYPVVLAPLVLRYTARTWGGAAAWCVAFAAVPAVFALSLALTDGPQAITGPLAFQAQRQPHPEWAFYDRLFPTGFAFGDLQGQVFRAVPVLLLVGLLSVRRSVDVDELLRRCAAAVILFVALQVIFSPQWWIWFATLLVPIAGRRPWLTVAVVTGELLTYCTFPLLFDAHAFGELRPELGAALRETAVWCRAALWFGILAVLVMEENRSSQRVPSPAACSV